MRTIYRTPALAVLALVPLWLAATAWMRPLMLPDEGRYVGVAWEMLRSGDWLTPTLNGLPFFHKPPLFYWITAGSMTLLGPQQWAVRVAAILGASLGAVAVYLFMQRWSGERTARLTLVALLVQPLFYLGGQFANLDMLVAGFVTATILLAAHATLLRDRQLPYRKSLTAAYAMAALGVLAKGLIGAVLPAMVVAGWLLALRRWRTLGSLLWWPGLLLFVAIAAPWFVAMQVRFPDFLEYFFVVQHFKRFAASGFNNVEPLWFYPVLLVLVFLPWLGWLWRSVRANGDPVRLLMWVWVLVVVAFFSLPQSKPVGYILPAVPPVAALVASGFLRQREPWLLDRRLWWGAAMIAIVLDVGTVVVLALRRPDSTREVAWALRQKLAPGDTVFMADKYLYDVPLYARLAQPVRIVEDWEDPAIALHDNERKELADAGRFAPAIAARLLVNPAAFPAALCESHISWVVGGASLVRPYPFLAAGSVEYANGDSTLWRIDVSTAALADALNCPAVTEAGPPATQIRSPPQGLSSPRA